MSGSVLMNSEPIVPACETERYNAAQEPLTEELQLCHDNLLIGRCIHLDTSALYDTPPSQAQVMHVDLAINVYTGTKIADRMKAHMNDADKVDASFRTHLLRAEGVPFDALMLLSQMFFQSEALKNDLFSDQFV
jgi:hypothetical protein